MRKVSRQEYLKKMEQKKLKELRDDIEDEQYLFDGVKLTKAEYGELRYLLLIGSDWRGAVAAVVCSLVLVLVKSCERNARIFSSVCTPANVAVRKVESLLVEVPVVESGGRKTIELQGEALQDERINGGAFIGTDGLQFPHKLIPTRNATGLVAPAIVAGLGALTHTLGILVPVIGAS
ncbi:unnamed protein product [Camellia sinensis]